MYPHDPYTILTIIFTLVDDFCKLHASVRCGAKAKMSDSELITVSLFAELYGIESERSLERFTKMYLTSYFPHLIDQSQINRRLKSLMRFTDQVRRVILHSLPEYCETLGIVDSTPVPVIGFRRAHFTPLFSDASFGHCAAKRMTYYGMKFHCLVTTQGLPVAFEVSPANHSDIRILPELFEQWESMKTLIGDKAYLNDSLAFEAQTDLDITILTPKRRNQKKQHSKTLNKLISKFRQKVETVFQIFKDQFSLEKTRAKSTIGLIRRIMSKITAFTLGFYLNKLLGRPPLALKSLFR
jgi:hypothetical protein